MEYKIGYNLHNIHVVVSKKDIIIQWGVNDLYVNNDFFYP
jgi:hypothetical protein